jgi:hypothetical protein
MKGRPLRGIVFGLLFGLSLSLLLLTTGVIPLDSILLVVIPIVFLLVGIGLAAAAPFKRSRLQGPPAVTGARAATPPPAEPPERG